MAKPGEKNISAFIDPKVSEQFKEHCDNRGTRQYKALEGAIRLWLTLTPTEQNQWIENKTTPASDVPSEDEIYRDLENLADLVKAIDVKIKRSEQARTQKTPPRRRRAGD